VGKDRSGRGPVSLGPKWVGTEVGIPLRDRDRVRVTTLLRHILLRLCLMHGNSCAISTGNRAQE